MQEDKQVIDLVNTHSDAVRARDLERQESGEWRRAQRAKVCRDAAAILYISSGACAAVGAFALRMGDALLSLGSLALAGVAAAVGYWCDKWSRR